MRTFFYVIFKKFSFRSEQNALFKRDKGEREKDLCSYLMVGKEVNSMEQSSSYDEKTVMHQFDRKMQTGIKRAKIVDYERHLAYLRKHETLFSELSEQEMESLSIFDEYELEKKLFSGRRLWCGGKKCSIGRSINCADREKKGHYSFVILYGNEWCGYSKKTESCQKYGTWASYTISLKY